MHHRGRAGEWVEMGVEPGSGGVVVRGLPCGAAHHLYLTAWNTRGTSSPSPVLIVNTLGSREYTPVTSGHLCGAATPLVTFVV